MPFDSEIDIIDLTSVESFPASDPPGWATGQSRETEFVEAEVAEAETEVVGNGAVIDDAQRCDPQWPRPAGDLAYPLDTSLPLPSTAEME